MTCCSEIGIVSPFRPVGEWPSSRINKFPFTLAVLPFMTTALARSSAVSSVVVVVVIGLVVAAGGDGVLEEDAAAAAAREVDIKCGGEDAIVTGEAVDVDGLETKLLRCAANRVAILQESGSGNLQTMKCSKGKRRIKKQKH